MRYVFQTLILFFRLYLSGSVSSGIARRSCLVISGPSWPFTCCGRSEPISFYTSFSRNDISLFSDHGSFSAIRPLTHFASCVFPRLFFSPLLATTNKLIHSCTVGSAGPQVRPGELVFCHPSACNRPLAKIPLFLLSRSRSAMVQVSGVIFTSRNFFAARLLLWLSCASCLNGYLLVVLLLYF